MAAASDRGEVDTARPFRSVKEAVAVFGHRILVGNNHSSHSSTAAAAIASPSASANATGVAATPSAKHEASSSSSTMTFSPTPMAESEAEIIPATVPLYSAPSSPPSLASSPSPVKPCSGHRGDESAGGLVIVRSIQKLEADVAATRKELAQLGKRGNEMEKALVSLSAQLHRGLSKLAEMEADRAAGRGRSIACDTDVASFSLRSEQWGDRLAASEYLPSFSHALSLGEMDDVELMGGQRRKAQKVKPIVPLIGDILFSRRKSTKEKGDDGSYSGDLYGVLG
ncbi:uncharacterized protein LOC100275804 [Zea mays]|jgi:hypothetical protein|uniref:Uncharacterized protein n=1 Tax=Zea mays TaxID=4577 RepID=B6SZH9_MAIZE|nr:uncharacterized protein LOC100275804 [Zea mays]ACG30262.1 hypothetical protein [Zea mays]ACG30310.1 hypothetical protein [Zea mays]|eukprot:NP_001143273.1 uncharacterized protein LOC100275804 [Zea mays]